MFVGACGSFRRGQTWVYVLFYSIVSIFVEVVQQHSDGHTDPVGQQER